MFSLKRIGVFFVLFFLCYGLLMLMAPWPLGRIYAASLRAGANVLFGSLAGKNAIWFHPASVKERHQDTEMIMMNHRTGARKALSCSSRYMGYMPTATLLALVLATPIPWSRKGWALVWGLVLVQGFVALRILTILLLVAGRGGPHALLAFSPLEYEVLTWVVWALTWAQGIHYGLPVLIWILVTFRRSDWRNLFQGVPAGPVRPV